MKSRLLLSPPAFLLALAVATPAGSLRAHIPQYGVGTIAELTFHEDRIQVLYDLSYDGIWAQAEMLGMDENKNSVVEKDEADTYLTRQWKAKISPHVRVLLDGQPARIQRLGARHEGLEGEIFGVPFSLFYDLEITFPGRVLEPGRWYTLEIHDTVVKDETPAKPACRVPYEGHGDPANTRFRFDFPKPQLAILDASAYILQDYTVRVKFLFEALDASASDGTEQDPAEIAAGDQVAGPADAPSGVEIATEDRGTAGRNDDSEDSEYSKKLKESVLRYEELSWGAIFGLFFLALAWGAGHALTPGHGKSMVAAYLIGTRGRIRDAAILGLTTTVTHTGSVFLFGGGVYLLINASTVAASAGHFQNVVIVGTRLASGLLLVIMGLLLFFRRMRGIQPGHDHGHAHGHGHSHTHGHAHSHTHEHHHGRSHEAAEADGHGRSHTHEHDHAIDPGDDEHAHAHADEDRLPGLPGEGTPRLSDLIGLGISGGLVPCPAGFTVIIIGLQYPHKLAFALLLLAFFSVGLGAVLIAIGVLLISGKALAGDRITDGVFFQELQFLRRVFPVSFLAALDRLGARALRFVPAASCLFIAGLGAFFLVRTCITGKTEIIAMLRGLADWLE